MIQRSTPYCFSIASSVGFHSRALRAAPSMRACDAMRVRYVATGTPYSSWRIVSAATRGSGVSPANARSKVLREMPRACASGQSEASSGAKLSGVLGLSWANCLRAKRRKQPKPNQKA